jgi:tetratricopeptide (TPR) repeat protein
MNYGKGFFSGMKIHSALPDNRQDAVSALYMQAVIGDSLSYINAIDDFITSYPKAYEGYLSLAEFEAVYNRDMDAADVAWKKAASFCEKPAEVFFAKGKVINSIVQSGDSLSHTMLSYERALAEIDKAIATDNQLLYVNYKADMLYGRGEYDKAYEAYGFLAGSNLANPEMYSKAAQCKMFLKEYDAAVAMLDSAVNCYDADHRYKSAPYILTRALLKMSAERYRDAVADYNVYEEIMGGDQNAEFYYMRSQAEVKAKMYQQALNDIDRAIYGDGNNVAYYIEKGMLCYRVKYTDEGIRTMLEAKELAPDLSDVHYLLGRLYLQAGNDDAAVESLERALALGHPDAGKQLDTLNIKK